MCDNNDLRECLGKFKECPNERHYIELTEYLRNMTNEMTDKEDPITILTDDTGVLIFNSEKKDDFKGNSFYNYSNGGILFNNVHEANMVNEAQQQKHVRYKRHCRKYNGDRIMGSVLLISYKD